MSEAIEQCRGQLLVCEDLDPLGERQVGGDEGRSSLMALGEKVEQQLAKAPGSDLVLTHSSR